MSTGSDHVPDSPAMLEGDQAEAWWAGYAAGVAAQPERTYLVPLPVAWRHVRARDAVRGDDGSIWTIIRAGWARPIDPPPNTPPEYREWSVIAACGVERVPFVIDPDLTTPVLLEVGHVEAFTLTREQLGVRLLATRLDPDGGHDGDLDWRGESTPIPR